MRTIGLIALATTGAAWLIAAYDNGWTASGWADLPRTVALVGTIAVAPLALSAASAAWSLADRSWPQADRPGSQVDRRRISHGRDRRAVIVLVVAAGWLAYLTVPYVLGWSPVLLVFAACFVVLALSGRRDAQTERPGSASAS